MLRTQVVLFVLFFSGITFAQNELSDTKYYPSFGFNLGMNQSILYNSNDTESLTINNALGFRMGVLADFPLKRGWSLSPKAELSLDNGSVIENNTRYRVDPANLNFSLHTKYQYQNFTGKYRPYVSFGPSLRVPLKSQYIDNPYNTTLALGFDFSFGVDINTEHFLLSPELRFTGGLTDIRQNPNGEMLRGSNAALIINFMSKR